MRLDAPGIPNHTDTPALDAEDMPWSGRRPDLMNTRDPRRRGCVAPSWSWRCRPAEHEGQLARAVALHSLAHLLERHCRGARKDIQNLIQG